MPAGRLEAQLPRIHLLEATQTGTTGGGASTNSTPGTFLFNSFLAGGTQCNFLSIDISWVWNCECGNCILTYRLGRISNLLIEPLFFNSLSPWWQYYVPSNLTSRYLMAIYVPSNLTNFFILVSKKMNWYSYESPWSQLLGSAFISVLSCLCIEIFIVL